MTIQIDLKIGIGYRSHANFGVGDQNLSGIPPMSPPDSQLMAPITTDSLNFTNNTEESGNSKLGGLDLSRRDLDRDLDLDAQKVSVSTVEKISTVFKS